MPTLTPRRLGLVCASAAVGLGLADMAIAGAPITYLAVNLGALLFGAIAWCGVGRDANRGPDLLKAATPA